MRLIFVVFLRILVGMFRLFWVWLSLRISRLFRLCAFGRVSGSGFSCFERFGLLFVYVRFIDAASRGYVR